MTPTATAERPHVKRPSISSEPMLPLTIRRTDGREVHTERSADRHRAIHLACLHANTNGYVEIGAGRRDTNGKLNIYTRHEPDHFLPGGGRGDRSWRARLLAIAERHHHLGEEVFVGVAPRVVRRATKEDVHWTGCLWMDVDEPGHAERIDAMLARFPAHLEIDSAGGASGRSEDRHRHLIWRLAAPQASRTVTDSSGREYINAREVRQPTGAKGRSELVGYRDPCTHRLITDATVIDWIERWNLRLIHHLGYTERDGEQVYVADKLCQERARVLRLAGTRNGKTGRYARIVRLDLWLPPYDIQALVGELSDPPRSRPVRRRDLRSRQYDAFRLVPAAAYFPLLANIDLPERGNIHCPSPAHEDANASCSVSDYVWYCHACGVGGTIYDLAALKQGGPTRDALAADKAAFHVASEYVRERCGHLV